MYSNFHDCHVYLLNSDAFEFGIAVYFLHAISAVESTTMKPPSTFVPCHAAEAMLVVVLVSCTELHTTVESHLILVSLHVKDLADRAQVQFIPGTFSVNFEVVENHPSVLSILI